MTSETKRKRGDGPKWNVPLQHPQYSIESCPNCEYPEAYQGYCPNCGWLAYDPTCPCKDHKRMRGEL